MPEDSLKERSLVPGLHLCLSLFAPPASALRTPACAAGIRVSILEINSRSGREQVYCKSRKCATV